ncbi:two-component system, chemotaxis family, response regulator CheY [Ketogulonicigenium robustum]|uniref:Two-component system, chemotaxis family, response regulator CheY n=1 Tax=Ketogulonicigenium robustum TaxID=92947 RepID=A0A1W6P0P5_9RHOB|nr:response regulator [Ketogulonicigenium robustum]ARO14847.1 two-component system, chemotaxis family, response regulator CheY [Ketogulonicigenium robustum]
MPLKANLQVMVVDDMTVSRALIEQALDWAGITKVQYEANGEKALNRLVASPVHLVISDYNMPGMDGLELLEALRANRSTQRIGFILITGTASKELIERGRKAGMNNFIAKPFTKEALLHCIEAVTGKLQ